MTQMEKPSYNNAPIKSLVKLAETLNVTPAQLNRLSKNSSKLYRSVLQYKKDGSPRQTWDAQPQLKQIHGLIKGRILERVKYPKYLQGGIRDIVDPRDYVRNASFHAGSVIVATLDIADFFPSITQDHIYRVWRRVFRFSHDVSEVLSQLCCKDGFVPQGARTSTYLANLVFWESEASLVDSLNKKGWIYSRLVDDITISTKTKPLEAEVSRACSSVIRFINRSGFMLKRSKFKVHNQGSRMLVNGLVTNVKPALNKVERNSIRGKVRWLMLSERMAGDVVNTQSAHVLGKLALLARMHVKEAKELKMKLHNNQVS